MVNSIKNSKIIWTVGSLLIGLLFGVGAYTTSGVLISRFASQPNDLVEESENLPMEEASSFHSNLVRFATSYHVPDITDVGKAVSVDFESGYVYLYQDGKKITDIKIIARADHLSAWNIKVGRYSVEAKEEKHYSPIAKVTLPYAVQIYGNAFFHGPTEGNGQKFASIELSLEDAKTFFEFVEIDIPVIIEDEANLRSAQISFGAEGDDFNDLFVGELPDDTLSAESYIIGDLDTGEIIAAKDPDRVLPVASISKLFTALIARDEKPKNLNDIYPMLLVSDNYAAERLAAATGTKTFVAEMNRRASAYGLSFTSFKDSSGLSTQNVSTARDLFLFARHLFVEEKELLEISKMKQWKTIVNHNKFVIAGDERYIGGKIGYLPEAGQTAVALFSFPLDEFARKNVGAVVLKSRSRQMDLETMVRFISHSIYSNGGAGETYWKAGKVALVQKEDENDGRASLLFVGDIMMDRGVRQKVDNRFGGDYLELFKYAYFLKTPTVTFGNLEGSASDVGYDLKNLYSFRMSPNVVPALRVAGFDVLSVANNHIGDWGRSAFEDTLNRLRKANILSVGAGDNSDKVLEPKVIEKNGLRIGFLGFSDLGPNWLTSPESEPVIALANNERYAESIRRAASTTDVLIVSLHFGEEYEDLSNDRQKDLARLAIDSGARIVVGHHPHVAQELERYNGGVIAYILGNFIFDQLFSEETTQGRALWVEIEKGDVIQAELLGVRENENFQPIFVADDAF